MSTTSERKAREARKEKFGLRGLRSIGTVSDATA
jgi:hypothetical protein